MTKQNKKPENSLQGDLDGIEDEIIGDKVREVFREKPNNPMDALEEIGFTWYDDDYPSEEDEENSAVPRNVLNEQQQQWEKTFSRTIDMFGAESSDPARFAAKLFKKENKKRILELGGGQGRDTLFFAHSKFQVDVLDYSEIGVNAITEKARQSGLSGLVTARQHDVRKPLPFAAETFDACYSHMLYCMALTTSELESLSREVHRVLRPNGLHIYTVRHTNDSHYGTGIHRGEDMYEVGGFIVHFFNMQKIEQLTKGYELISVDEFEEGALPRKLFRVVLRKQM